MRREIPSGRVGRGADPQGRGDVGTGPEGPDGGWLPAGAVLEQGDQDQDEDHTGIRAELRVHSRGAMALRDALSAMRMVTAVKAHGVVTV